MKNVPAFKAALLAAGGIIIGREFPGYSYLFLVTAICASVIVLSWFFVRRDEIGPIITGCVYVALFLSFAFYMSTGIYSSSSSSMNNFCCFSGKVEEAPRGVSASTLFLENCFGYNKGWKKIDGGIVVSSSFNLKLSAGDRVILVGKPSAVSEARNPGDFDLKSYYELSGIAGRIYVKNKSDVVDVSHGITFNFVRDIIEPVRNSLRDRISRFMSGDEAELAKAIIVGERAGISKEINEQFVNAGTVHILAVAGLHVGFLTGMLMIILSLLRIPRRLRFFVIAPFLILYAFVVGMMPSVTRAVIMALIILFGLFLQRRPQIFNSLGFAALVILTFSPSQLFTPGFQLSFAAVMSIAFFHQKIFALANKSHQNLVERPLISSIVSLSILTIAATIGTVPLTAYYFNRIFSCECLFKLMHCSTGGNFYDDDVHFSRHQCVVIMARWNFRCSRPINWIGNS